MTGHGDDLNAGAGNPQRPMVDLLARVGREQKVERGEVLFHRGDRAGAIFGVARGRLRLDRYLADGRLVTVGLVRGPSLLAEAALFSDCYQCSATAETGCTVYRVETTTFLEILERDPSSALALIRGLVSEVRELRSRLELRDVRPASERLLQYLRLERDQNRPAADRPLTALAAELGLTPEALYRVVARLEAEGLLRRRGRRLELVART